MKYRYLGDSGMAVSCVSLGTMTFGMQGWGCDERTAVELTNVFIESGGNLIDTADMYSQGLSEEYVGKAIQAFRRDDIVLATKCWFRVGKGANAKGLSRKHIIEAAENSLRRLKTDFLDLYQLHGPDPHTPIEITMRAMEDLVWAGKVRYVGCSNFYGWQIVKANAASRQFGGSKLVSAQHLYNLLRRDVEREILPACQDQSMSLLCWGPLASGLLTGKYDLDKLPEPETRVGMRSEIDLPRYWNADSLKIIEEVQRVAQQNQKSPSQIALAWLLHNPSVASVIVGVRSVDQLRHNLEVSQWSMSQQDYDLLSDVVPFRPGYPQEWIELTYGNTAAD